ncbi:MAG: carbamoyltransferase C-terminal domain-containing protein [Gammaproteobacteria bacterium]|jgi:carbamoyltransferase|nr:carbamoyltransferase [Gammaproteobacteria bacterium]MDP6097425.1 carbamoyltransferase C-terminal domain-containing protein [Gammaproteobacteria bacterium]HJO10847.1 carbamoyltransferase C-terminal domain-containing protein [Gammaproteobacteria bacterium]
MAIITLGLSGAIGHDPAAALFIDGELVAAVEEERMLRRKHAKGSLPYHAARECMQIAGVKSNQIDVVAMPYAPVSLFSKARWHYAYRHWYAPDRCVDSVLNGNRRYRRYLAELEDLLGKLHIPLNKVKIESVEHQLAHASSCYHLSGSNQKTAILSIDAKGEYANVFLGFGEDGRIHKIKEFYNPDSLSGMYAALTDYLGFEILDGEFKVMGIAPYGDAGKYDLSSLARFDGKKLKVNNQLITTVGIRRYRAKAKGHYFSQKLVDLLGPRRVGNLVDDPYIHYAAAIQKLYEDITVEIISCYLKDIFQDTNRLAIVGTGAMNIRLNQRLLSLPEVHDLIVHPACGDAGTAIGAAAYAINQSGQRIQALKNMYLGPSYSSEECIEACRINREKPDWEVLENPTETAAKLIAEGSLVAWFQGRMEFGPRALGNRSILANPAQEGVSDLINKQVKFRESWRPFSPSILDAFASDFLEEQFTNKYMCVSLKVREKWRAKYPAIIGKDGETRAQVVTEDSNPKFYQLLTIFKQLSGHSLLINTALNRPGEALVCSPDDAIDMFHGADLDYLIMENILVTKRKETDSW